MALGADQTDGGDPSSPGRLGFLRLLPGPPGELEATFSWSGRSPARARRYVTGCLVAWGCDSRIDDAAVIVSELATNAVVHARTGFTVALSRRVEGSIRIAVADASPVRPRPRPAGPRHDSGRGLRLVDALSDCWGTESVPGGKVVWAELSEDGGGFGRHVGHDLGGRLHRLDQR